MPLVRPSTYSPPLGFWSGHLQTVYPTVFRRLPVVAKERERIATPDDDFLDLDWARETPSKRLAILTHGLEGSSRSPCILGSAYGLVASGWNVLAWNLRGCSGEPNLKPCSYHSGSIDDLETVLKHAETQGLYECIVLIGYSLGGNITLKFLGDLGHFVDAPVRAAVAISVPCDLAGSVKQLEHFQNRIYMRRLLKTLKAKTREKIERFPGKIADEGLDQIHTLREFDEVYTAPLHGFLNAADYWRQCTCLRRLANINVPTLMINAQDDPFLTTDCYPIDIALKKPNLFLEMPKHGGHMGFVEFSRDNEYWADQRIIQFLDEVL